MSKTSGIIAVIVTRLGSQQYCFRRSRETVEVPGAGFHTNETAILRRAVLSARVSDVAYLLCRGRPAAGPACSTAAAGGA